MPSKRKSFESLALDLVALVPPDDAKAVEVMLSPWGDVKSVKGDFIMDDESAKLIGEAFAKGKKPIPIDYEHATLGGNYSTPSGAAPAAGWITEIRAKPGQGIFAVVKWNDAARAMIQADEYRYLSPVLMVRKDDRKAVAVTSAALTNTPAIVDMERVAAKDDDVDGVGEKTMDLKELRAALAKAGVSLADDADDGAVLTAAKMFVETAAKAKAEPPPLAAVAAKLGLDKASTCEVIVAKVAELQTNVPASEYKAVTTRLETLELAAKDRVAQQAVGDAVEAAKLNPNDDKQMTWARAYAKSDAVGFKSWVEATPALYSSGRLIKPDPKLDGADDRMTVIAASAKEYGENRGKLQNVRADSFVNQALREKDMAILSADETKALKV
jgi:phage I-like protein